MTDNTSKVYEESSMAAAPKQRKKRKWDQPAESFISAGLTLSGVGSLGGLAIPVPGVSSLTGPLLTSPVPVTCSTTTQAFQVLSNQQSVSTILQKLNLPKMQDELVAREIVINDAESTVRYKLTKRQTQEEIQRCTGAVVITRGKYRPPNALPDNEKPLYLHISAGSHLKEMAERIKAVDQAAAMVEEMLKQSQSPNLTTTPYHSAINVGGQVSHLLSACVFLGFNTNSSLNICARIRGPNDQYINHIMNETGASVVLRGQGLENSNRVDGEELSQPLHLFLSAKSLKSLEDAKLLAENLLDTVAAECGASRATSSKVYKAVPPPPQLLSGGVNSASVDTMASLSMDSSLQVGVSRPGYGQPQRNPVCYQPQTSVCGTSYNGYGGIYPQTTPLQQVALVLSQSPSPVTSFTAPATAAGNTSEHAKTTSITETGKRPLQRRKFQELPVSSKLAAETHQNSLQIPEFVKPGPVYDDSSSRGNTVTMPPPKKLGGMPPPPPRSMPPPPSKIMPPPPSPPPPPPPPKLMSAALSSKSLPPPSSVPDTLFKLMEYGDDDDDDDDPEEESENSKFKLVGAPKPFWAL